MNTLLSAIRTLLIVIIIALGQALPVKASSPTLTAPQIAKIKSVYILVRAADAKTMIALRAAIKGNNNVALEYAANEAIFSAASKTVNERSKLFYYAYQNGIHKDAVVVSALDCLFDIEYKYREFIEKIFDSDMYSLDPVDDAEQIEDEIFSSASAKDQIEKCGKLEATLGL